MLLDNLLIIGSNQMAAAITHVSIHTTGPVTSSANESAAARRPVTVTVDADGDLVIPPAAFTGGASNGPAVRLGFWSASSSGTYYGGHLLTGDQTFNAAGAYNYTGGTESNTSS